MLTAKNFLNCMVTQLEDSGFGGRVVSAAVERYNGLTRGFELEGHNAGDAAGLAMQRVVSDLTFEKAERAKRTLKALQTHAEHTERVAQGLEVSTSRATLDRGDSTGGVALARGAVSLIEDDPRFQGVSYATHKETTRGLLYASFADVLDTVGKGAFGRQLGTAHLPNAVRELFGEATGDANAKQFAQAYNKAIDVAVDMFNAAGGSLRKRKDYRLPQGQSAAKLIKTGFAKWRDVHMRALDWDKMRWPDGSPIDPVDHGRILTDVYKTLSTNGASKIDTKSLQGRGGAVGNALEKHRFLEYKDAESWIDVHETFGDGNVFDIMIQHMDDMAHKIASVRTFGPNPELAGQNLHSIVRRQAAELGGEAVAAAEAELKNTFDPMFETAMRSNPMDPNSTMGSLVVGTSNLLTSAQLGSAAFLAIPGDFMQTAAVRALNGMNLFGGVDFYVKSIATEPAFMKKISAQSGFVMDEAVMATYGAQRFTGVATVGPPATRRISDAVMRASLLSPHTRAARWSVQAEFMGLMSRSADSAFEDLPYKLVLERYGITPHDWDTFRGGTEHWTPREGIKFLRPIDLLKTNIPGKDALYRKMQGMVFEESRKMVPESTIEGSVRLKDTTRPDTLVGGILHSFSMYKNFPISFMMVYGRLAMSSPGKMTRLKFVAGLGAGMTMVGALGTQLRELSKGRDPLPMDNVGFMGKAFLSGGALSIWGDFLFAGVNEYGRGPEQMLAGPLGGFLSDTTQLAFGDVFKFADSVGGLSQEQFKSGAPAKAVEFARRYTPGTSLWWARLALERQVFDRMQEMADPRAYASRNRKAKRQKDNFGNESWWAPGDRAPGRAPSLEGVTGN
ncbi:MAG: hypothetical protein KAR40_15355 [Candidatus Sabulitectum sp.]|nr:hypothetical protein [Candidatus Sabulitectum sp.]